MTASSTSAAEMARELEADLERYPEERGDILLEAADAWRRAGEHDRAVELLREAVTLGGEDGGNARVALADLLFDLNNVDEATAQLAELRRERPSSAVPYHLAGELLEERGDLQQALVWFNMAAARLTDQEKQQIDELGFLAYANGILAGRRRVRQALGMPADDLDESVADFDRSPFATPEQISESLAGGRPAPRQVRVLFWPRPEVPRAHERWPQLVEHADVDVYFRDRERANRDLSESGVTRIGMVPLTVAGLVEFAERTGADPTVEATRRACLEEIVAAGGVVAWPPARNAACWCGSSRKYKKCCGRPTLD